MASLRQVWYFRKTLCGQFLWTLFVVTFCRLFLWTFLEETFCGQVLWTPFVEILSGPLLLTPFVYTFLTLFFLQFLWTLFVDTLVDPFYGKFVCTIFVDTFGGHFSKTVCRQMNLIIFIVSATVENPGAVWKNCPQRRVSWVTTLCCRAVWGLPWDFPLANPWLQNLWARRWNSVLPCRLSSSL